MRAIGGMWISGAIVAGAGALEGLWSSNLNPTFAHLGEAGGVVLVLAFVATAGAAARAGSRLPLIGVPVFVVGWLTLFVGVGAVLVLLGFALYVLGVARSQVVERHALVLAVGFLLLALPVTIASDNSPVGIGLALAAAWAAGIGAIAGGGKRTPPGEQSSTQLRSA